MQDQEKLYKTCSVSKIKSRKHYGCASLSGAELEDQGEEGTAHWEKRLFEVLLP